MILQKAKYEKKRRTILVQVSEAVYGCDCCKKEFTVNSTEIPLKLTIFLNPKDKSNCSDTNDYEFCSFNCLVKWLKSFEWNDEISFINMPHIINKQIFEEFKTNLFNTDKVTRVEVIDEKGRSYVNRNEENQIKYDLQDNNKTLKIFIQKKK